MAEGVDWAHDTGITLLRIGADGKAPAKRNVGLKLHSESKQFLRVRYNKNSATGQALKICGDELPKNTRCRKIAQANSLGPSYSSHLTNSAVGTPEQERSADLARPM